jgi:signal transduction histidine kinase
MAPAGQARDTEIAMLPRQATHQNIYRLLIAGFSLVILMLLAAAIVGLRNIQSIQENASRLVHEQDTTRRLVDELRSREKSLGEVFSILARDPDSVDAKAIFSQLADADRDIERISAEGAHTPQSALWNSLRQTSAAFSGEARRILSTENLTSFASLDLFRDHEAFTAVVARLIESDYRNVSAAQAQIDRRSSRLLEISALFASGSVLLALIFAALTVRMASQLIRAMEWQAAELSRVSWHMLQDQEATARRFSHELHDELGQSLTAVKTNLAALRANAGSNAASDPARLDDCLRQVDESIGNVRQMSQLLRPTILDDFGLEAGLRWLCEGFAARTGIEVDCVSTFTGRLPDETETHLFRIAQEALTNVARHSGAHHVEVRLASSGHHIRLTIQDDGHGLPQAPSPAASAPNRKPGPLGLIGMRARARSAGGDVTVRSRPDQGVLIDVQVPLPDETHSHPVG